MGNEDIDKIKENSYLEGQRAIAISLIKSLIIYLYEGEDIKMSILLQMERSEAISKLRQICEIVGDNDWEDDLHLVDILDKHLLCYLEAKK